MYKKLTICEMIRQVNDICQKPEDAPKRKLLQKIYTSAKKMNDRLNHYAKKYEKKRKCDIKWQDNPIKKEVTKLRESNDYIGLRQKQKVKGKDGKIKYKI